MDTAFSFWEIQQWLSQPPILIIGAGIVGLSTALSLREGGCTEPITVIDRRWPPHGASSKNAGFICFGSPTEIIDDLNNMSQDECISIINRRWLGAHLLLDRLQQSTYQITGGYEVFDHGQSITTDQLYLFNELYEQAIGIKDYAHFTPNVDLPAFDNQMVALPQEGMLDPMKMMIDLYRLAEQHTIHFFFGEKVSDLNPTDKTLTLGGHTLPYTKCVVCTNGFARQLLPTLDVTAVRNQVIVTQPIDDALINGVYHYHKGYYYFRNVGDRLLLGGARNIDLQAETTDQFGITSTIQEELASFKGNKLNNGTPISYTWSGILGVGNDKNPIIQQWNPDCYVGVRMGGMGVAIGSWVGHRLSQMILDQAHD